MDPDKTNTTIKKLSNFLKEELAIKTEKGIYEFSKEYSDENETPYLLESIYNTKLDEILDSLCNNKDSIKTKDAAYRLAFLTPEELNPDKYEKLLKKKEIIEYKKNDIKSSSAFKCSKCKKNRCEVSQKQVLAGDEPVTTFVKCLECGHSFSFH
jgi:DNA-directed RNA polymerase subunit M/transcription elongation factor TFIIS